MERGERAPGWTISELGRGEEALGGRRERRFHSPKCSQKRGGDEKQVGGRKKEKGSKEDGSRAAKAISLFPSPNLLWRERFAPRFDGIFLHLWESEDSWKIVSNFRMHAVLVLLEPKMSIPFRASIAGAEESRK